MKNFALLLGGILVMAATAQAHARSITIDAGALTQEKGIALNVDGTISILEPKVFLDGRFVQFITDGSISSRNQLCSFWGLGDMVRLSTTKEAIADASVARFSMDGIRSSTSNSVYPIIVLTCKQLMASGN